MSGPMVLTEAERAAVDAVVALARDMHNAGRIEIQLRPGYAWQVFGVHRKPVNESVPLRDDDSREARARTRETAGRT